MGRQTVLLCVPWYSSLAVPLKNAFSSLGLDVVFFDYRTIEGNLRNDITTIVPLSQGLIATLLHNKKLSSKTLLNQALISISKKINPSLIFFVKGETITTSTLKELKTLGYRTFCWQVDSVLQKEVWDKEKNLSKYFDFYLTCEPGKALQEVKKSGNKHVFYMLGAADHTSMTSSAHLTKKYDICIIGSYHPIREQYIKALSDLDVHIWGWGDWKKSSVATMYHGKSLKPDEMMDIYKHTKIVINIGRVLESTIPTNLKPFEAAQVGAFILVDHKPNLKEVFIVGKEIDSFNSPEELRKKVEYYLGHPDKREKMANALQRRVKQDHTYQVRLKNIFKEASIHF